MAKEYKYFIIRCIQGNDLPSNRIKLKDEFRLKLFTSILLEHSINLKQLSKQLGCGYSAIKKWRSGASLIPENTLEILVTMSATSLRSELNQNILANLPDNWGEKLGGKLYVDKYKKIIKSRMIYVRKFKPSSKIPNVDDEVWELIGVCLGDGCLSKYFSNYDGRWSYNIIFTGHMTDDFAYYTNFLLPLIKDKFNVSPKPTFREEENVIVVAIRSKPIFNFFKKLGMPVGKKLKKIRITKPMKASTGSRAAILRGLLDTDGHIFARKDEGYKYPYLKITSGSNIFLKNIKSVIRGFGLPAYIHGDDVQIRGGKNLKIWMQAIGSSHPTHINRYNSWLSTGKLLPKRALSSA
ncbi:MAG: hypothetical protein KGH54_01825 [Candidatus Micrarchaeota archaeon]|nr:hypothetical protein [Candidatus Micrarchaeota archaeon]